MNEARHATAIHEAGHAVVSYLLGRQIKYVVLKDERRGETMTDSSFCDDSLNYYKEHDPKVDPRSSRIQDDLRSDIAIAVAGEIAQRDLCGDGTLVQSEITRDLDRASCGAAHIHRGLDLHRGLNPSHCNLPWARCQFCEAHLEKMRSTVKQMLARSLVKESTKELATDKLESLNYSEQRKGSDIEEFFQVKGLIAGSEIDSLPPVPEAGQSSEVRFPSPFV